MQSQVELAPPTLEKVDNPIPQNSRCPKNLENIPDKSKEKADDEKRPSSPPKLSRFDEKPPADPPLLSPISEQSSPVIQRRKNQTMPLMSPISEDERKLPSPRPDSPKLPPQIDIFDLLLNGKSTKEVQLVEEKPKEIIKTSDKTTSEKITEDMEKDAKRIKSSEKITE